MITTTAQNGRTLADLTTHTGGLGVCDHLGSFRQPTVGRTRAQLAADAAALLSSYCSSDRAFLDIVFGATQPEGSLPFDLPRSMAAVEASRSDVPFDTAGPVFKFGHGLRYSGY